MRFDYENRNAVSDKPYEGLRSLGPSDIAERRRLGKKKVRALIDGRTDRREELEAAAAALVTKRMGKLHDVFEIEIVDRLFVPAVPVKSEASAYRDAVREWFGPYRGEPDIDLAFLLHEDEDLSRRKAKGLSPYYASKAVLLMAG